MLLNHQRYTSQTPTVSVFTLKARVNGHGYEFQTHAANEAEARENVTATMLKNADAIYAGTFDPAKPEPGWLLKLIRDVREEYVEETAKACAEGRPLGVCDYWTNQLGKGYAVGKSGATYLIK